MGMMSTLIREQNKRAYPKIDPPTNLKSKKKTLKSIISKK